MKVTIRSGGHGLKHTKIFIYNYNHVDMFRFTIETYSGLRVHSDNYRHKRSAIRAAKRFCDNMFFVGGREIIDQTN